MKKEYNIIELNPRKNSYSKELKKQIKNNKKISSKKQKYTFKIV